MPDPARNQRDLPPALVPVLGYATVVPRRNTTLANAALILGILCYPGCLVFVHFVLAPLAVVLGIIALRRARRMSDRFAGRWQAIVAICLAAASVAIWFSVVAARRATYGPWGGVVRSRCAAHLQVVGEALTAYALDNGGFLPSDLSDLSSQYLQYPGSLRAGYPDTPNSVCDWDYVLGLDASVPANWILAYGDPKWFNNQGGPILYVDGSVKLCDRKTFEQEMQRFLADYERVRGTRPTIIPAR